MTSTNSHVTTIAIIVNAQYVNTRSLREEPAGQLARRVGMELRWSLDVFIAALGLFSLCSNVAALKIQVSVYIRKLLAKSPLAPCLFRS